MTSNHRTDRAWVATRKGLFELRRTAEAWRIERISFLGEPVSMVLPPQDGARMLAALNLGHFGVKLHASDDAGTSWHEVATPSYPGQPDGAAGPAWKLLQLWSLEAAHGIVWAGTLPGGLFRSADFGTSWQRTRLEKPKNKYDWQRWTATMKLPTDGYFEIWTRATDSKGAMQPHQAGFWNPQGYGGNAMHRIAVLVG